MKKHLTLFSLALILLACGSRNNSPEATDEAQAAVDQAIAAHGGEKFETIQVGFDFRDKHYTAVRNQGLYTYTRSFTDTVGKVQDVLTNEGFTRTINGKKQDLPADRVKAFSSSVNSVIYFALLPYGLNDPAVQKEYLGTVRIKGKPYHKIQVTFSQEGGGQDYQDTFLYWINQQTNTLDYLAYTYATEESGVRFREAINPQTVGGIRFQDYINYEPAGELNFRQIDQAFEAGQLKELSRIELKNIQVLNQ